MNDDCTFTPYTTPEGGGDGNAYRTSRVLENPAASLAEIGENAYGWAEMTLAKNITSASTATITGPLTGTRAVIGLEAKRPSDSTGI